MDKFKAARSTDDELYSDFLRGDSAAIEELMTRYGNSLTIFIYGYLHDMQDAEDMMIEAFARIVVKRPVIRSGGFKAYLFKTGRNLASRQHMLLTRLPTFCLDDIEEEISDYRSLEDRALDMERKRALNLCLDRIDPQLKEALWLVYVEELSYEAAARIMGISRKRVDKLLQKGKEKLRAELDKEEVG